MKKLVLIFSAAMLLHAGDLVIKEAHGDVGSVMNRLVKIVKEKGAVVLARIDHRQTARKAGMDMNDEQLLLFSRPRADTRIMLNDPRAGLDLPMKILVYRDFNGKTWIVYRDPMTLKKEYRLDHCAILPELSGMMKEIADTAAK